MDVKLVMFKANGQRRDFPLTAARTILGRGEECDLRIPLLSVSRHHCELLANGDGLKIRDLASSNGTYVNNKRINEQELVAGDRISVGPMIFTVQVDGQPEEISRPAKLAKPAKPVPAAKSAPAARPARPAPARPAPAPVSAGDEEIVDLEADVITEEQALANLTSTDPSSEDDVDVISALEALSSDDDDEEDDRPIPPGRRPPPPAAPPVPPRKK